MSWSTGSRHVVDLTGREVEKATSKVKQVPTFLSSHDAQEIPGNDLDACEGRLIVLLTDQN
jgi:hypothetical protein